MTIGSCKHLKNLQIVKNTPSTDAIEEYPDIEHARGDERTMLALQLMAGLAHATKNT